MTEGLTPTATRPPIKTVWKLAVAGWAVFYAVPPSPLAPLFGSLVAVALGPPYLTGYNEQGWPTLGPFTPRMLVVTVLLPWVVTSLLMGLAAHLFGRERRAHATEPVKVAE